jgi:hypothetical protein
MSNPSPEEVDAGAKFLRETTQGGKNLMPWKDLPKASKRKWLILAEGCLLAAARTRSTEQEG